MSHAVDAAHGVLTRVLGAVAARFELELVGDQDNFDAYEVSAKGGIARVRGASAIALCRGAYDYLKRSCHVQYAWSGDRIVLKGRLPNCPFRCVKTPYEKRFYLSVCTYGYSTPWWDWDRWEQELDWMALHGINMPLLMAGQEFISRKVFLELGFSEMQLERHFAGPAYLPWHRLGNLNGTMGPLPVTWIDDQAALQKRIMDRARELGMFPVVPGFSGFVPADFRSIRPGVELFSAEPWAGFEKTTYIDPQSNAFGEVGLAFLSAYRESYGPAHHYICETFAEQLPCLESGSELEDIRAIGASTWNLLVQSDPEATWVMQGWPFYFAQDYWTQEKAAALLERTPNGRAFILDLATEELELWRRYPVIREKGWSFNVVHNYGQTTHLHGDLQGFLDRARALLSSPDKGLLQGMGASPEGIDQNLIVYELLTDLMWSAEVPNLQTWITEYVLSRYGCAPKVVVHAWTLLLDAVYGLPQPLSLAFTWRFRPGDQPVVPSPDPSRVGAALSLLLRAAKGVGDSSNFRRDVVDVCKTWLGAVADAHLRQDERTAFFQTLADLDRLMATRKEHRLSTWLEAARAKGATAVESDLYERNARAVITHWGGPYLFDYAIKEWAGLIADFHAERWRLWFAWKDGGHEPDFAEWERSWALSQKPPTESAPEDELLVVSELWTKRRPYPKSLVTTATRLEPSRAAGSANRSLTIDLGEAKTLVGLAIYPIFGQGCRACYTFEGSIDGNSWNPVGEDRAAPTCRGARASFTSRALRFIRVCIHVLDGGEGQLFQPVVFEAG